MGSSLANKVLQAVRSQLLGLGAQLIAAAPIIAMSIYLSRAVSLAAVADFALLIGVSSVIFTLGMIGLRSRLVLDRFRDFSEADYYSLRLLATGLMASTILIAGLALGASPLLTLAVVFLRIGDAALDLTLAVDQVRRDDRVHIYGYLNGSSFKLVMIVLTLGLAELTGWVDPFAAFALAGVTHAVFSWALFMRRRQEAGALLTSSTLRACLRLIRHSFVFAAAQIICAILTSMPRLALQGIADRDLAGATGAALSVSTLLGMAYLAIWLRWVPHFGRDGLNARNLAIFGVEVSLGLAIMLAILWAIGAPVMGAIFAITEPDLLEVTVATLIASAVFFFVMTLANLFKPTRLAWTESLVYLGGIVAMLLLWAMNKSPQIPALLLTATVGMLGVEAATLAVLKFSRKAGTRA